MSVDSTAPQVLIVGAGPTGLVAALWLARRGIRFRIVDQNSGPGEASRAMAVQARTLEFYRQLGIADEVVSEGIPIRRIHLREGGEEVAVFDLRHFGEGLSPFPFVLSYPQDDHERLLVRQLAEAGVGIDWNTRLESFAQDPDGVSATLVHGEKTERIRTAYLCGCDGARSRTRHGLGVGFPGGTYEQDFFVADVSATGRSVNGGLNLCLAEDRFCLVLPVRSTGMQRVIGIIPPELRDVGEPTFEQLQPTVEEQAGMTVEKVNWFSKYRVHHRVAERFQVGRIFLAGDAAHIHSPAGGQGMNTGIGDAVNLAWKLAAVLRGKASPEILKTYGSERISFAHTLVATTDRVFTSVVRRGVLGRLVREVVFPELMRFLLGFDRLRRAAFRTLSQARIHYPDSDLSEGSAGEIDAGDRLPWVPLDGTDNFAPLASLDWQAHLFGQAGDDLRTILEEHGIPLHVFEWDERPEAAGFARDRLYLVRPDGHVAFAAKASKTTDLTDYLLRFGIRGDGRVA